MKMKTCISLIYVFLSCLILKGQEVIDLSQALQIGLIRNYEIKIIRNEQQITDNNATLGNAGYLPEIGLTGGYSGSLNSLEQKYKAGENSSRIGAYDQTLNTGIELSWTVFDGFSIQGNYEKLKELQRMGELNTRLTIENFIAGFTAEYYNYIQQNIRLRNLESAVQLSRERLRIVEARYNIGSLSRLDLQQAKVDFNADSSSLIKQYEVLHVSRTTLNEMMASRNVEAPIVLSDTVIEFDMGLNREYIWEQMIANNTLLLLAQRDKKISEIDLKIVRSQDYPYLRLNAGYGYNEYMYQKRDYDRQQTWGFNYGLTVGYTLFDGFNRSRRKKNARIEIQNKELEYEQLALALETELSNMWMAYQNNMQLTNLEEENLKTAKENYEIAIERYKLGELSGIELREAQNSLLEAEERLVQAQYNTKICEISLAQISGQLSRYLY